MPSLRLLLLASLAIFAQIAVQVAPAPASVTSDGEAQLLTKRGYYTRETCPSGSSCVEVFSLDMWVDYSQSTDCSLGGGYTCRFPYGATAVAKCADNNKATVRFNDQYDNGDNRIDYDYAYGQIKSTFELKGTEVLIKSGFPVSAYLDCSGHPR